MDAQTVILPPAPRRVRLRGGWGRNGLRLKRLITLPFILFGMVLNLLCLRVVLFACLYSTTNGIIDEVTRSKGGTIRYTVSFEYPAEGEQLRDKMFLLREEFVTLAERVNGGDISVEGMKGRVVEVRFLKIGAWSMARLALGSPWRDVIWPGFGCVLWNGICGAIVVYCWIKPMREWWLVRNGNVATGRVVKSKGVSSERDTRYEFQVPETGEWIQGRIKGASLSEEEADVAVTVIYTPGKPQRNVLLELSEYEPV